MGARPDTAEADIAPGSGAPAPGTPAPGTPAPGTPAPGTPVPGRAHTALRERWFACSNALGWSAPAEWAHATVDDVCAAVVDGRVGPPLERALAAWAGARAGAGIGLAETLSDLSALHTAVYGALGDLAPREGVPGADGTRLLRLVSLAWTDVACGELSDTAAVDPLSGLASARYLRTRLAEVYRSARARGTRVGDEHALVAITMAVAGWSRVAPLTIAGDAAAVVFDAGESLAVVGRSSVVVLAPREGLAPRVRVLRGLLDRRMPAAAGLVEAPSVRIVSLPATHEGACAVIERIRETSPSSTRRPGDDDGPDRPTADVDTLPAADVVTLPTAPVATLPTGGPAGGPTGGPAGGPAGGPDTPAASPADG